MKKLKITVLGKTYEVLVEDMGEVSAEQPAYAERVIPSSVPVPPVERNTTTTVSAPMSGTVEGVTETNHAYSLVSEDGIELLVHIGIDTVTLRGEGFVPMVSEGDRVKAGDVLARVDLSLLQKKDIPTHTVVLITNPEHIKKLHLGENRGLGGKSEAARYETV